MAPGWNIPKAWGPQFILTNDRVPTAGGKPSSEHRECSKVTKRKRRERALTLEASLHFLCQGAPWGSEDKAEPSAGPVWPLPCRKSQEASCGPWTHHGGAEGLGRPSSTSSRLAPLGEAVTVKQGERLHPAPDPASL